MLDQSSRLLQGLNNDQQRAVITTEGPVLVVAGPGSGKTRVLTHRIAYLIEEKGITPNQILAVTFTNKAAREMRDRIERLINRETAEGLVMGTFHSLGVRILRQNPGLVSDKLDLRPNFLIYDSGDQAETAKRAITTIGQDPKQIAPRRMLSRISAAKSVLMSPDEMAAETQTYDDEIAARVYKEYERQLRANNAVDFDDLLGLPIRLFDQAPSLLERYQRQYRYIMVDEYQDTNRVQYVMVAALSEHYRNLFVVGDPDQSIYGWRQADIKNILDFEKDYPDANQIHLEINYRSTQRIVQAADRLIRDNEQRIDRKIRTENPEGEPIAVRELSDQNHEAQFVVSEIRRLTTSGRFKSDDIAIMYRTTAQSRVLEEAFRVTDIPYRIVGGVRFYERKEVRDVLAVLRLLHNPADRLSLERMIDNLPVGRGFGPKAMDTAVTWAAQNQRPVIDAFLAVVPSSFPSEFDDLERPPFSGPGKTGAERIGKTLANLREKAKTSSLAELFDTIVQQTGFRESFNDGSEEDLQRWANVLELRADLERFDMVDPADALAAYLEQVSLIADVDSMEDDDRGQVTLITLHSAKGLEFPVVFITGVEEGLLPISRAVEAEAFDRTPMEEERRLFYVGVTRAEKLLYLTYAASRISYGRFQAGVASRFLQSIPAEAVRSSTRSGMRSSANGRLSSVTSGPLASR
ncbi:MAG TPA: UvrD-helicase domain-containing protein, partial [Thermomicrobiales bacterium]|nr:UvrD-helicase domain-containing protein [Thermomicrobiales bacterium]